MGMSVSQTLKKTSEAKVRNMGIFLMVERSGTKPTAKASICYK